MVTHGIKANIDGSDQEAGDAVVGQDEEATGGTSSWATVEKAALRLRAQANLIETKLIVWVHLNQEKSLRRRGLTHETFYQAR
jgi:hypothetical protein